MGFYSEDEVFQVEAACRKETERAILVEVYGNVTNQMWVPKSVIHDDSEVYKAGTDGQLIVKLWWAEKEGLV